MQSFDCLVIVYSDPAVFALQVGQLDVVVRCRLIYFHDFHRFVEKGGKDELGFIISSRILKEPLKLDVLEFVQTESVIIRMLEVSARPGLRVLLILAISFQVLFIRQQNK